MPFGLTHYNSTPDGIEAKARSQGILGVAFLKHFRMSLDYANRKLYLEQQAPFEDPRLDATYGVVVRPRGGRLVVSAIANDGPATRAGIERGDTIVSIAGLPVGTNAAVVWPRLTPDAPGQAIEIEVERDGARRQVKLEAIAIP